ncbi:hypothetical protein CIPAW_06G175600 [Carya illinoinensis]|uniref:Uncharacterized protein n=1 Tax=Carya illinoinensis TaxID=32201 RepID=A0A8T1QDI3_CARIL|nr:hypothetical protein CIPAW_06G175600 [Carya illinoinensis]
MSVFLRQNSFTSCPLSWAAHGWPCMAEYMVNLTSLTIFPIKWVHVCGDKRASPVVHLYLHPQLLVGCLLPRPNHGEKLVDPQTVGFHVQVYQPRLYGHASAVESKRHELIGASL